MPLTPIANPMRHQTTAREALGRLLEAHRYSLPIYLRTASPWAHAGNERVVETLHRVAADQQALAARIAAHLVDRYDIAPRGAFPARFTSYNDLAIDYLVSRVIDDQREKLRRIEGCVTDLRGDPDGRTLAEEALGTARGHLQSLMEAAGR